MSLSVAALRIVTVKALDDATTAAGRIFDSAVDPRDLMGEEAAPTVVVYADRGHRKVVGRDLLAADHCVTLSLELFVAKATVIDVPASDGEDAHQAFQIEYPATDPGLENRLRRLAYEIETVLTGATGVWPGLWRRIVTKFAEDESEWDRGADASKGRRFNFIRLQYHVEVLADPVRGATPDAGDFWSDLLSAMDADEETDEIAKDWRALITTPNLPEWRRRMSELGLTYDELRAIGLAPVLDHQTSDLQEAAELVEVTLDPTAIVVDAVLPEYI